MINSIEEAVDAIIDQYSAEIELSIRNSIKTFMRQMYNDGRVTPWLAPDGTYALVHVAGKQDEVARLKAILSNWSVCSRCGTYYGDGSCLCTQEETDGE